MHFRTFVFLAAGVALAFAPTRTGDFRVIGPGGGGSMYNPTISPHDPKTVLVSCDMTGAYITHDGGQSWRMFNLRGVARFFVFDPGDAKTIYAQATGLWRSRDSGDTWQLVYPKPSTVKQVSMADDHAGERIQADLNPVGTVTALAIDPANSRVLYAGGMNQGKAALWVSRDYGDKWDQETPLTEPARKIWVSREAVYVGGVSSITTLAGGKWERISGPTNVRFTEMAASLPKIYGVSRQEFFVSRDGGSTWSERPLAGNLRLHAVATSLNRGGAVYVSYSGREFGVAKSTDDGDSWQFPWKEAHDNASASIRDNWMTSRFGPSWPGPPYMLGVAPTNPNIVYGTDSGRTLRSIDGGETWDGVYSHKSGEGWTTTGLDVTTCYGYHFDPFDSKRQFISYTDIGLFRSEDGGNSWVSSTTGVPGPWVNTTYWLEFDPEVRGRVWGVMSYTHDLPRPKMWRDQRVENYRGGVCRSDDGGRTWTVTNSGMPQTATTHIVLDPKSPRDARTLYVAAFGRGVYKSTDGGKSWLLKNEGISQKQPFAWRLERTADSTLYVVIARGAEDGSTANDRDGAVYKSTDGAEHWASVKLPAGVNGPNGLTVDARDPKRLYLAAWARAVPPHGQDGGIYLSSDGGSTWRSVFDRDQHIYDVTQDRKRPDVLYASGFESSAWRSTDRGEHWTRIPGYNFKWGHRVIPDPADAAKVYITTFGGSVWHGRVDGNPTTILDIATPEMQPGR